MLMPYLLCHAVVLYGPFDAVGNVLWAGGPEGHVLCVWLQQVVVITHTLTHTQMPCLLRHAVILYSPHEAL
jgi:hypothetical protein